MSARAPRPPFEVVLVEPEIPWNTGNVGRTCLGLGARLHLVGRLGFSLEDKFLKRAGLDYWPRVGAQAHPDARAFFRGRPPRGLFFFSARARKPFWRAALRPGACLVFGAETRGLPRFLWRRYPGRFYRIPQSGPIRSLNLSTAVGIVLAEALRQASAAKPFRKRS
jgi:tRNA (cytidine/uridine-2'-O-)-methyltransferase